MDQLKNFLPLIIFVAVYVTSDIYMATAALMVAVSLQVALYLLLKQPLSMELKLTFWVGLIMGSLTLFFRNELFIQWKTTVINWLMAGGLIATHFFGKAYGTEVVLKSLLRNAAEKSAEGTSAEQNIPPTEDISTPRSGSEIKRETADQKPVWRVVNFLWIGSFTLAGALNLIVAYNASLDFWVTYKLVGGMALSLLTIVITMVYLYKKGLLDDLKQVAGCEGHAIFYIGNGHAGWEASLCNTLSRGDRILALVTGRFSLGWVNMARQLGIEVETLEFGVTEPADPARVQAALEADTDKSFKALITVQTDTSTSTSNDIPALRKALATKK